MKSALLLIGTNLAVIIVLGFVMRLLGVDSLLLESGSGLNYQSLLIFASVFGFGGAFISLAISKWMAKRSTGAQVIEQPTTQTERWLLQTVQRQAERAGIGMPEVAIFDAPEPNAFATGMSRNNALVAVSTGLLANMSQDEVEAVLGHEVSHVANGDMVTMTLIQGVVNTFVIFIARIVGFFVDRVLLKNENGLGLGYYLTSMAAEIVFGILASIITAWFSRVREFRADIGGADLAGRQKMIAALQRLQQSSGEAQLPAEIQALGIAGGGGLSDLFRSHPPLEQRIAALQARN
jgi:heat shock protein HtpX